ncbi:hypothetical protein EV667_1990 [Ancylobacter aquaticus]|uniref:Uncharacterized protein n=1 Tax=Ancylobacter aquaticus TaxID=100 RepID=A0A4R1HYT3_ANCAQ|nr:hypothetical protein [Ancylobacter aquaticus]TCK27994.1 hypothetical protein EV667_1990 [Ancylobacter aquaticus]
MSDKQAEARAIIEDALSRLRAMGMTPDGAASLLVIQGAIRVESAVKRKENANFVASCVEREDERESVYRTRGFLDLDD